MQVASNSKLGGVFNTTTDANGNYKTTGVPVGGFTVNAENLTAGTGGSASGTITTDGDIEIVNIQMVSNVVSLTQTLTDANGFKFNIQKDGSVASGVEYYSGQGYFFGTADYSNAFHLALFLNGTETDFTGNSTGTGVTSLGGQEISIEQDELAGLNVVRHVYVSKTGYFARYVESLTNPTSAPITVDVQVSGGVQYPSTNGSTVVGTSSGDATLSTADQWLVTNSTLPNPWPLGQPVLGEVFEGPGAPQPLAAATLTMPNGTNNIYYPQLAYRWNSITIAPGTTVEFMHFAVQQSQAGQATAAVQRLVQQPPEIFAGLAASDAGSIQNFAVSSTLTSTLPALTAPSYGTVTGHVYGADDASPVPGAEVTFQGSDLFYGSGLAAAADANGAFTFNNAPIGNFTLSAEEPEQQMIAPAASGQFASGATAATQDVIYSNAAVVKGTIVAPTETTYTGAVASLLENNNYDFLWSTNIGTQPNFTLPVVPPGTAAEPAGNFSIGVQANAPGNNGVSFFQTQPINPKAGDVVSLAFNLPDTGSLTGTFTNASGAAIANTYVYVSVPGNQSYTGYSPTDSNGKFQFSELAVGTYTLTGTDPATGLVATASPVITAGNATTQNLQIANGGTISLSVTLNGGAVAANSLVTINRSSDPYGSYVTAGVTDSNGKLTITAVPVGNFNLIAYYPGLPIASGTVQGAASGSIPSNGQTVTAAIVLPATSILTGTVNSASGTPVSGGSVSFNFQGGTLYGYGSTTTNSSGVYTFSPIVANQKLLLTAQRPNANFVTQITATTAATGTLTQNITLPVDASVVVTAVDANNNPLANRTVAISGLGNNGAYYSTAYTQGDGTAAFTGLRDGSYGVILYGTTGFGTLAGSAQLTVATTDDGKTLQATVQVGYTGTINGTILAADGVTPAPPGNYYVTLTDADSQSQLGYISASDGTYNFPNISTGVDGYSITVSGEYFTDANEIPNVTVNGKFTANGQTQTTNATVAIPVVSGTVYQSDGATPVANPNVYASISVLGNNDTYQSITYQGISGSDGSYSVPVPAPAENASIVAEAGGLTTQAQVNVNIGDVTDKLDISLHASGTVTGTITDEYGGLLNYQTSVYVQSTGSSYTLYGSIDPTTAAFSIPYVATGDITVTASYLYYTNCTGTATGTLANNGDTLNVQIVIKTSTCTYTGGGGGSTARKAVSTLSPSMRGLAPPAHFRYAAPSSASTFPDCAFDLASIEIPEARARRNVRAVLYSGASLNLAARQQSDHNAFSFQLLRGSR